MYASSASMTNSSFCNADGDFLIVPQQGTVRPCGVAFIDINQGRSQ